MKVFRTVSFSASFSSVLTSHVKTGSPPLAWNENRKRAFYYFIALQFLEWSVNEFYSYFDSFCEGINFSFRPFLQFL